MRFVLKVFAFLVALLGGVAGFNWYVDPYGYFLRFPFGLYEDTTFRHIKARVLLRDRPEAVLFGASTAVQINPDDAPGCKIYNASFNGARPTEELYVIRNFLPPNKLVIIGLDLFAFNRSTEESHLHPDFGRYTPDKLASYLLSMEGTEKSVKTIKLKRRGSRPEMLMPNGQREVASLIEANARIPAYDAADELTYLRTNLYVDWQYNSDRIETLRRIRDELQSRGTKVAVYISPMGQPLLDMLTQLGVLADLERFRRDVRSVFPDAVDFNERDLAAKELYYKHDPLHFLPAVGGQLLRDTLAAHHLCGY